MDNNRGVVLYFDHGGHYSDEGNEVRWNRKDKHICSLVLKGSYEEVTYDQLVDRIRKKMKIGESPCKLQLSYFPLVVDHKTPCYIWDDEDVLGFLMEVDNNNRRSVLHVEVSDLVSESQSNEIFSRNEAIHSDARGVDELGIVPHIQYEENEESDEVSDEMPENNELAVVTPYERSDGNVEWDDGIDMTLHQEFETRAEVKDLVDKAVHKNCFEVMIVKSNPKVYILKCRAAGCSWYLRAAKLKNSDYFAIRTYRKMHTCSRLSVTTAKKGKKGTTSLVASVVHDDYPGQFKTPAPKTLIDMVQNRLGVTVSYSTAWRGKKKQSMMFVVTKRRVLQDYHRTCTC